MHVFNNLTLCCSNSCYTLPASWFILNISDVTFGNTWRPVYSPSNTVECYIIFVCCHSFPSLSLTSFSCFTGLT